MRQMAKKDDKCDGIEEKCANEMMKLIVDVGKEFEKLAERMDRAANKVYEKMPEDAKNAGKDLNKIANSVVADVREDIPKISKELSRLGRRFEKYLDDINEAMQKK
jgi:Zn-dependent oligopeptidase